MDDREHAAIGNAAFVLTLRERGVRDTAVLRAMEQVRREDFAPADLRAHARRDIALPLPCGQTMTMPTRIAAMLVALAVPPGARVLEVGTGSGFSTALLKRLGAARLRSLERFARLAEEAGRRLAGQGAGVELADGLDPDICGGESYDRILVNGCCPAIPAHLRAALAPGGRLVGVVETAEGPCLALVEREASGALRETIGQRLRLPPLTPGRARAL